MARSFCRTLTLRISRTITSGSQTPHAVGIRIRSNQFSSSQNPHNKQLTDDGSSDALIRKLEDAIRLIIARRSAPDWLPFVPGSSYWVPPVNNKGMGLPSLVAKLTDSSLSAEESLSTTSVRGWPSSSYFITEELHIFQRQSQALALLSLKPMKDEKQHHQICWLIKSLLNQDM